MGSPLHEVARHKVDRRWELRRQSARGLFKLGLGGALSAFGLLALDIVLFREARPPFSFDLSRVSLVGSVLLALGVSLSATRPGGVGNRPDRVASLLVLLWIGAGAVTAADGGGINGYYPFGLLPLLLLWAAVMPGGLQSAIFPVLGGVAVHVAVLQLVGGFGWLPSHVSTYVFLALLAATALAFAGLREAWYAAAAKESRLDSLTEVLSWVSIENELRTLLSRRDRTPAPVSLALVDVDRFKEINHKLGRTRGDRVLQEVAGAIRSEIRVHDSVGRVGGDEMLIVLDACTGTDALTVLERVRRRLMQVPTRLHEPHLRVSFSAGVVCATTKEEMDLESLLVSVERALRDSKDAQHGRSSWALSTAAVNDLAERSAWAVKEVSVHRPLLAVSPALVRAAPKRAPLPTSLNAAPTFVDGKPGEQPRATALYGAPTQKQPVQPPRALDLVRVDPAFGREESSWRPKDAVREEPKLQRAARAVWPKLKNPEDALFPELTSASPSLPPPPPDDALEEEVELDDLEIEVTSHLG